VQFHRDPLLTSSLPLLLLLLLLPLLTAAPPIPNGRAVWKPQWDELKDFTDNEVIVSVVTPRSLPGD
jgi:hypothetical protein